MHPLLLLAALVAALFFISWYKRAPKANQRRIRNRALLIGGGILLFLALITGKLHPLFAGLAALVPLAYRAVGLFQTFNTIKAFTARMKAGASPGPAPGQTSEVETAFLRMRLDHDSGEMEGEVLRGRYEGCTLGSLDFEDLLALLAECRSDRQSAAVLEAYLDRTHAGWHKRDEPPSAAPTGEMGEQEARAVLGIGPEATRQEIVEAHRRLMQRLHPDRGGSDYLAAKLNAAKDVLLGG